MDEEAMIDALLAYGPSYSRDFLLAESAGMISERFGYPPEEALSIVTNFEDRQLIKQELTPQGGVTDQRVSNPPDAKVRWTRVRGAEK